MRAVGIVARGLRTDAKVLFDSSGEAGLGNELGETGDAEDEEAAGHLGAGPEQQGSDGEHGVCILGECDGVSQAEASCNAGSGRSLAVVAVIAVAIAAKDTYITPTPKMIETPSFFCQFMCRLQMTFCGSKTIVISVMTWTLADASITLGRE